jgi:site-specific recombinase XerD
MKERAPSVEALSEEVLERLEELNYTDATITQYQKTYDELAKYSGLKGVRQYSLALSRSFLFDSYGVDITTRVDKAPLPSKTRTAMSRLRILNDYYLHGAIIAKPNNHIKTEAAMSAAARELLYGYVADSEKSEQSAYGIDSRRGRVRRFLVYLDSCSRGRVSSIDALVVTDYVKTLLPHHEKSIAADLVALRSFLRWLYREKRTETDWSLAVPKANRYNYPAIPSVWEKGEVSRVLESVDRASSVGKRDYVAFALAAKLGMRMVDIRFLRLCNLDFAGKKISFVQHKTGNATVFPMTDEIGWALADWLKNARPKSCPHDYVLSLIRPPFGQVYNLGTRLACHARSVGISIGGQKHHGMHSLRHTLASTLLEQGVALPLITDVLGHMDPKSTSVYLRCDIEGLRACAIEPDGKGKGNE